MKRRPRATRKGRANMIEQSALYDRVEIWGRPPEEYQANVRSDVLSLVPAGVGSILDVGCGDGFITNELPRSLRVVGLDVGTSSLAHVTRETVVGSVTSLPFPDRSFDLVMANDMLEHLPDEEFRRALPELTRVAGRYVIVTVPFMENLAAGMTLCGACGTGYHINHHHRAFGVRGLLGLFASPWKAAAVVFSGAEISPAESIQRELKALAGFPVYWDAALCPACGERSSRSVMDPETEAEINAVSWELAPRGHAGRPGRNECIVLYANDHLRGKNDGAGGEGNIALVRRAGGSVFPVPCNFEVAAGEFALSLSGPARAGEGSLPPECMALEYWSGGTRFSLPRPVRPAPQRFLVPPWFLPGRLPEAGEDGAPMTSVLLGLVSLNATRGSRRSAGECERAIERISAGLRALSQRVDHVAASQGGAPGGEFPASAEVADLKEKIAVLSARLERIEIAGGM